MKSLIWLADTLELVRDFPSEAKAEVGHQLHRVQQGLEPTDWKPMSSIGLGVKEIRVNIGTTHRVFYVAKFAEAVYVLHAMTKKTQKTPQQDIELAAKRFRQLASERKHK
jgi:putative addiction module killer protein